MSKLCENLEVSRSGYYAWRERPQSQRSKANELLLSAIQEIYRKSQKRYGSPRVIEQLKKQGVSCSKKRVERLMKSNGIKGKMSKRKPRTLYSRYTSKIAPHLLKDIQVTQPNTAWISDLTYVPTQNGWLFLCVILDAFSRKVVGWSMKPHLKAELSLDALNMAVSNRKPDSAVIFHSDRGIQYACKQFRDKLSELDFAQSMSRKANPYDNAMMESFFASLKREVCDKIFESERHEVSPFREASQNGFV